MSFQSAARQLSLCGTVTYLTGQTLSFTPQEALSFSRTEGVSDGILLGSALASSYTLALSDQDRRFTLSHMPYGASVTVSLKDGNNTSPLGKFIVSYANRSESTGALTLSGTDVMGTALESLWEDQLTYPVTLGALAGAMAGCAGLQPPSSFPGSTLQLTQRPAWGEINVRKALAFLCEAAGCFAVIDENGQMNIRSAHPAGNEYTVSASVALSRTVGDGRFGPLKGIQILLSGASRNEDPLIVREGQTALSEENCLYISGNPLLAKNAAHTDSLAQHLFQELQGLTLRELQLSWSGDPALTLGRNMASAYEDGDTLHTLVTRQTLTFSNGFSMQSDCTLSRRGSAVGRIITPSGALNAAMLQGEADGSILRAGTVAASAIVSGSITAQQLAAGAVTTEKLNASAVTTDKLDAQAVTAGKIAANAVTTGKLAADAVTAAKIAAGAIEAEHFSADALTAINAEIQNANISYAKIRDASVQNLITKDAIADRYYIDKLQVRNLQVIEQTVGNLVVKASNGNYYRLDVGNNGAVTSTQVTVTSGEIAAGVTNTGRSIIETDLTVSDLAASNIKGANALIDKLTAARISVDELFARDATIGKLQTTDISSNTSLQTYVANRLDFTVGKLPFVNPNILLAADTDVENTSYPTIRYDPYVDAVTGQEAALVVGEQYTFTVRLQTQSAAAGNVMLFTGGGYVQLVSIPLYSGGTAWFTYGGTFTFNGYGTQHPEDHQLRVYCTPQGRPVRILWAKLEKGDHATDFCLSPAEMKNSGISIKPDSLNIYSSGIMNIASDGKMIIESGAEGRINLNDGSISTKNLNAQELTVGGKQVGVNAFMLSLPAVFTQGASSAPAGHGFLWLNASGSSYSSAQTRGATSDGYLPRTFTLDAPENTLSAGTFTYTCTCAITNRQGSNPATITPNITVKITNKSSGASVSFAFDQVTVRKWESKNLTKTVTTTVNLFGANAQFDAECTFTRSGGTTGTPDMDSGVDIVLTATKQNAGGAQSVTVQYVP